MTKYLYEKGIRAVFISALFLLFFIFVIPSYFFGLLSFVVFLFLTYIYFVPQMKNQFIKKDAIYSPVDGKVLEIDENNNEKTIKIYSSLLDNSFIKMPISGKIKDIKKRHGAYLCLKSPKSKHLNEIFEIFLENEKIDVKISSITDYLGFFGFEIFKQKGLDSVATENIGFASNALFEITLPKNVEIKVTPGDQVVSGINAIALLKEEVE
ncbi:phosphatidylserine decarboxylase [Nitrosophilus kaiyonis]|uniref:phosphatidylserine decarboxylase n=1 Tax=Nitrosophilus kaiyonis TaxID=2930200 RepID=UPI002491101C|nr:phosphatidylserine decarboxylase [Nitrosophilus kaiyonis]